MAYCLDSRFQENAAAFLKAVRSRDWFAGMLRKLWVAVLMKGSAALETAGRATLAELHGEDGRGPFPRHELEEAGEAVRSLRQG
ncbi:MAG: hypothetical protein LBO05_07595 [Deltaproteobacteria bacterium]|nr:hypothetical protein [Deltaproteobacteria bacterium]